MRYEDMNEDDVIRQMHVSPAANAPIPVPIISNWEEGRDWVEMFDFLDHWQTDVPV